MRIGSLTAVLCIATLSGCGGPNGATAESTRPPPPRTINSAATLKERLAADAKVYNALDDESYEQGHIPGSLHLDYRAVSVERLPVERDREIIFYCAGGGCPVAGMAARKAASLGYSNVWVYGGGMKEWTAGGNTVATGRH